MSSRSHWKRHAPGAGHRVWSSRLTQPGPSAKRPRIIPTPDTESDTHDAHSTVYNRSTASTAECSDHESPPLKSLGASLACPFYMKDPAKYSGAAWKCQEKTLSRVRDVKQHLARRHMRPPFCHRCGVVFRTEGELGDHSRNLQQCVRVENPTVPDGLTNDQKERWQKCPRELLKDDNAQWFLLFDILFPNLPPPMTAYTSNNGYQDGVAAFQAFSMRHGPKILAGFLHNNQAWDKDTWEQRMQDGLQALQDRWERQDYTQGDAFAQPWSPGVRSTLDTTGSTYYSPASTGLLGSSSSACEIPPGLQDGWASGAYQDLRVPETRAVEEARRVTRKEIPSMSYTTSDTRQNEPYDFNDGRISEPLWTDYDCDNNMGKFYV